MVEDLTAALVIVSEGQIFNQFSVKLELYFRLAENCSSIFLFHFKCKNYWARKKVCFYEC